MESFIQQVVREAGDIVLRRFGIDGEHYRKSDHPGDVVTKADLHADKFITDRIRAQYPEHGIISEESGSVHEGAEYVWVVDPIDGTQNFARHVPMFGVMICLLHKGEVILSAINIPTMNEVFFAKAGVGTFLNGTKVTCSQLPTLHQSSGAGSARIQGRMGEFVRILLTIDPNYNVQFSSFGCMSVNSCYVAAGRRDWVVPLAGQVWDFAPVSLILKEAGCTVTDTRGNPWTYGMKEMVAANPQLHSELLKLTRDI